MNKICIFCNSIYSAKSVNQSYCPKCKQRYPAERLRAVKAEKIERAEFYKPPLTAITKHQIKCKCKRYKLKNSDIAKYVGIHISTLSHWYQKGKLANMHKIDDAIEELKLKKG